MAIDSRLGDTRAPRRPAQTCVFFLSPILFLRQLCFFVDEILETSMVHLGHDSIHGFCLHWCIRWENAIHPPPCVSGAFVSSRPPERLNRACNVVLLFVIARRRSILLLPQPRPRPRELRRRRGKARRAGDCHLMGCIHSAASCPSHAFLFVLCILLFLNTFLILLRFRLDEYFTYTRVFTMLALESAGARPSSGHF